MDPTRTSATDAMPVRSGRALVGAAFQLLDLFLKSKLSAFQVCQAGGVGGWAAHLIMDRLFKALMLDAEFAKTAFDSHGLQLPVLEQ
jgi:hypothetical protein